MMKKMLCMILLAMALCPLAAQFPGDLAVDYTNPANWAIYTPAAEATAEFDIFYIYPTLYASRENPYMPWDDEAVRRKVQAFAKAQLSGFSGKANLYSPYVRQLEFYRCIRDLKGKLTSDKPIKLPEKDEPSIALGVSDAIEAFQYYLTHLNNGRPYVLVGHSQGAIELSLVLLMNGNIGPDRGFVAAYLPGVPLKLDSRTARLPFATGKSDVGVVVVWNTQSDEAGKSMFAGPGTACINPLNWKTDSTPAAPEDNPGAFFYNWKTGASERIPNFCGAVVDPEKGALIIRDAPADSPWLDDSRLGKGIYHAGDLYFFYDAIVENVLHRVGRWQEKYGFKPAEH